AGWSSCPRCGDNFGRSAVSEELALEDDYSDCIAVETVQTSVSSPSALQTDAARLGAHLLLHFIMPLVLAFFLLPLCGIAVIVLETDSQAAYLFDRTPKEMTYEQLFAWQDNKPVYVIVKDFRFDINRLMPAGRKSWSKAFVPLASAQGAFGKPV